MKSAKPSASHSKTAGIHRKLAARSWIEATFQKRECVKFIPSPKDEHRCCCGLSLTFHCGTGAQIERSEKPEIWSPARHTLPSPTDAYGTIEFQGGPHPSKAQVSDTNCLY
uniref:Uncharacterized protein n=1 Tax=Homalodisca liturata TaxID=320908 RepID=A0A1B6JVD6_9HEMI